MSDAKNPLVLIIDDDDVNRQILKMLLEKENINFLLCENGYEGINIARKHKPDLILLDLLMPDVDGLEVLRQIKQDPELKNIEVIIFTIVERSKTREIAFELGAAEYMTKPFDMNEIVQKIKLRINRIT